VRPYNSGQLITQRILIDQRIVEPITSAESILELDREAAHMEMCNSFEAGKRNEYR